MKTIRISSVVAALALALGATGAGAESLPVGVANSKNLVERTVTIDDQTYRVTDATRILNKNGRRMSLADVTTEADMGPLVPLDEVTYAYDPAGDVLVLLRAQDARR
jgi:hypothetical protein